MENNSYTGPALLSSRAIWAKTWLQSLSWLGKQLKTDMFENRCIQQIDVSFLCVCPVIDHEFSQHCQSSCGFTRR